MEDKYYHKYIKYKNKYNNLKKYNISGGGGNMGLAGILKLFLFPETLIPTIISAAFKSPLTLGHIVIKIGSVYATIFTKPSLIRLLNNPKANITDIHKILIATPHILTAYIDLFFLFMKLFGITINEETIKKFLNQLLTLDSTHISSIMTNSEFAPIINDIKSNHAFFILIIQKFINPEFLKDIQPHT
jgi:hypothetical protein